MHAVVHKPVMIREVVEMLDPKPGDLVVDCTVGCGGHAEAVIDKISPSGILVGIDKDAASLGIAKDRLSNFEAVFIPAYGDFRDLPKILEDVNIKRQVDGVIFDLGISSKQMDEPERGFSISRSGPLDMRMDSSAGVDASFIVNKASEEELDRIISDFGEERFHRRIAGAICRSRREGEIKTTSRLAEIVLKALPRRGYRRIHPATRTFQAIRIAVNGELDALKEALDSAVPLLAKGARICVISFHSLEDRIVKNKFRSLKEQGVLDILTKKPLTPKQDEMSENRRSRSAKMRVAEKL